jgi:hypothetical protein
MPVPDSDVREWRDVTPSIFRDEILPSARPAVLRGAVAHWPSVRAGAESPRAMSNYLLGYGAQQPAETMFGEPAIGGKFFYNDQLTGLNFQRRAQPLAQSLEQLLAAADAPDAASLYVGALPLPAGLPGFADDNRLLLLDPRIVPRIWISNRVTVQTHYDVSLNCACVVAGRRRFTLFPPEQLANLYVGPLDFTLAGQPVSMVSIEDPDHERFPRFREAWRHAQGAELGPGDALFIPYMWWHHVEALEAFNVLVNYWWDDTPAWAGSPFEALVHALMSVHSLPPEKRAIWQKVFEHHVFESDGDPAAHLAPHQRGIQGTADPRLAGHMRAWLLRALSPRQR